MEFLYLSCAFENCTRPSFRFKPGMSRQTAGLDRKHAGAFPSGLHPPGGGRFEDETRVSLRRLPLDKCAAGKTPDFFVAGKQDRQAACRLSSCLGKESKSFEYQHDPGFHIE